jgi:hypothetical protein
MDSFNEENEVLYLSILIKVSIIKCVDDEMQACYPKNPYATSTEPPLLPPLPSLLFLPLKSIQLIFPIED